MQPELAYTPEIEKQIDEYLTAQHDDVTFMPVLKACKKFGNAHMYNYRNSPTAKYHW